MLPAELKKLNTLTTALYERPGLNLEIKGSTDATKDGPALALFKLDQQLKTMRLKELAGTGDTTQSIEQLTLLPADSQRLLVSLYQQTFGTNQTSTTNLVLIATNVTPAIALSPSPSPPVNRRTSNTGLRGVELLTRVGQPSVPPKAGPTATNLTTTRNSVPSSVAAPESPTAVISPEAMQAALVAKMEVTDNDLRRLMQDRAKSVQAYLLQTGKVTAERLFLISPKPTDIATSRELRVNLTLN